MRALHTGERLLCKYIGSEVLTAVVMKRTLICDTTPCCQLIISQRFGGTYRLHLQSRGICQTRYQSENRWQVDVTEDGGDMVPRNVCRL
jgi:hypothetical protein